LVKKFEGVSPEERKKLAQEIFMTSNLKDILESGYTFGEEEELIGAH